MGTGASVKEAFDNVLEVVPDSSLQGFAPISIELDTKSVQIRIGEGSDRGGNKVNVGGYGDNGYPGRCTERSSIHCCLHRNVLRGF